MNRPFIIIAVIGAIAVAVAIGLNFMPRQSEVTPAATPQTAEPEARPEAKAKADPAATTGQAPAEAVKIDPPTFDVVRVNPDGNVVIAGRAAAQSTVVNIGNEVELGRVRADDRGEWVLVPEKPLKPGSYTLRLEMLVGSLPPVPSVEDVVVIVPEAGKDIAGRTGDGQVLAMKVSPDGSTTVLQKPGAGGTIELSVDAVDYDEDGRLSISGGAKPGATIQLYLDNRFIGHARAGEDSGQGGGRWSMRPDDPVEPGLYTLRADQIDNAGKVLQRVEFPFSRAARIETMQAEAVQTGETGKKKNIIVVQPGNSLWRIARSSYGEGLRYTVIYEANKDQIGDPDLIYPGQVFKLPEND